MSVKASFDDCKTWPLNKLIFAGPAAYSGLAVGKDGLIFLIYERARLGSKDSRENISIARFNLKWLKQNEIEPPQISPQSQVFFERQKVVLRSDPLTEIRYTLDGSKPGQKSLLYSEPFELSESTLIKTVAFSADGTESIVTPAQFIRSKYQAPEYKSTYNPKYPASGPFALVDSICGSLNYHDGRWQGFEEDDMDVILDLGTQRDLKNIQVTFLQSFNFWIFFPQQITISVSHDGSKFKIVGTVKNARIIEESEDAIQSFSVNLNKIDARYIRVKAENIGLCPQWHKGAGGKAWLFVDEIEIR